MSVVTVDRYGRIRIPKNILERIGSSKFVVFIRGNEIVLKPLPSRSLKEFFDSIEIDIPAEAFMDYDELKKHLLRREST